MGKNAIISKLKKQQQLMSNNDFNFIFELTETKHGEPVLIYWSEDIGVNIIHLQSIVKGKVYHSQINLIYHGERMIIADIQVLRKEIFNRGYGSVLMNKAISFAKENNISFITGDLMTSDDNHFKRQKHFYEKHGFEVIDESEIYQKL